MVVSILGGGLTGLSAAFYLLKKLPHHPVTIIESTHRVGGWVKSNIQSNGIVFEQGPRTIRPKGESGRNTLILMEALGLSNHIIPILSSHPAARNRMIYANGKLHSLPSSISSLFRKHSPFSKPLILQLLNDLKSTKKVGNDDSIYDFSARRFGKEFADYLISPLICGICAGNAKEISVKFIMKQLFEYEQTYGSISVGLVRNFIRSTTGAANSPLSLRAKRENWSVYSLKNGLETLPKTLHNYISDNGVQVELDKKCEQLDLNHGQVTLHFTNAESANFQRIISAIPPESLSALLQKQHPILATMLKKIKNVTVAVINLQYDQNVIPKPGFGFLVPPKEKLPILGVIYDSCCFPNTSNQSVLTVMMGGFWFEEFFGTNPSEEMLLIIAKQQLKNILNITCEPNNVKVNILEKCIPQYIVGHEENITNINKYIATNNLPISLCGAGYYGVGVNDVILSAKNAVDNINF